MSKTIYIRHLSQFYLLISEDTNLNSTHVSLYMALFQFWNLNRFKNPFYINRGDVMRLSKIGSKSTYHKCLRDLDKWKYIIYYPSHSPLKGSAIKMYNYGTSSSLVQGQPLEQNSPKIGQVLGQAEVSLINNNKQKETYKQERPNSLNEVILFFNKNEWPKIEAEKFFSYYESLNWKIKGITKIYNWKSSAKNWMLKAQEMSVLTKSRTNILQQSQNQDNLKTRKNKNYNEPL
jgi:hypothetical protein